MAERRMDEDKQNWEDSKNDTEKAYLEFLKTYNIKETWDYDYRAAFEADATPDDSGHWPSKFKHDLSEERFVSTTDGWLDTKASDIKGKNVYAPWTEVMTHEMKRSDFGDFSFDQYKGDE